MESIRHKKRVDWYCTKEESGLEPAREGEEYDLEAR